MASSELAGDALDNADGAVFEREMMDMFDREAAALGQAGKSLGLEVPTMSRDIEVQPLLPKELRLERV